MTKPRRKAAHTPTFTIGGEVVLYKPAGGQVQVDVRLDRDTVWLSLNQMAELFGRDKSVVSRHLNNVFRTKELHRSSAVAKNATVQTEGRREVVREIEYFNLDAILSVGYRVNSKQGTQFRIWATRTLREHLLQGYTLNEKRLRERGFGELEQAVELLSNTLRNQSLVTDPGRDVLDVVQKYTRAWRLLLAYDEDRLSETPGTPVAQSSPLNPQDARAAIGELRKSLAARNESTELFGRERGEPFSARSNRRSVANRCIRPHRRAPLTCCTSSSQGPSVLRWQQAYRHAAVPGVPAAQWTAAANRRRAASR